MSTTSVNDNANDDYRFANAHGTVMIISWIIFASTGILFVRYGRLLRIKKEARIFGTVIWFQVHRLALSLTAVGTLLGFFLILAQTEARWVDIDDGGRVLAHSILGVIIVCCAQIQLYMALFRCHSDSRFRFIFNWMHRLTGLLAFTLSVPTIFLIVSTFPNYYNGLVAILSLWSAWVVIIVIIFETIEYRSRRISILSTDSRRRYEASAAGNRSPNDEMDGIEDTNTQSFNRIKLFLFGLHIVIAVSLAIPLIVLVWIQS